MYLSKHDYKLIALTLILFNIILLKSIKFNILSNYRKEKENTNWINEEYKTRQKRRPRANRVMKRFCFERMLNTREYRKQ